MRNVTDKGTVIAALLIWTRINSRRIPKLEKVAMYTKAIFERELSETATKAKATEDGEKVK